MASHFLYDGAAEVMSPIREGVPFNEPVPHSMEGKPSALSAALGSSPALISSPLIERGII